jgi:hypothetical protein
MRRGRERRCRMVSTLHMRSRFQKFIWRVEDLVTPKGPPFFLTFVVVLLLIVNGIILLPCATAW